MKKKFVLFALALFMLVFSFAAVGCDSSSKAGGGKLAFGKKYISESYINNENIAYYVFNSDGTGEYTRYIEYSGGGIIDFTLKFVYTYADKEKEGVYCFYDRVTYGNKHNYSAIDADWTMTLAVSDNVLMSGSGGLYVNEDYAAKYLTNFNKTIEL